MAGKKQWSAPKKTRKSEAWAKARKTEEARRKASNNQNVAPGAHNGHSIGGYSIKKHGRDQAEKLADLHTRPMTERRAARHEAKRKAAAAARAAEKKTKRDEVAA